MKTTKEEQMDKFIEAYNLLHNVPDNQANKNVCEQYKKEHPNEFKNSGWSIVKHRKKLMDWFSRQGPKTLELLNK